MRASLKTRLEALERRHATHVIWIPDELGDDETALTAWIDEQMRERGVGADTLLTLVRWARPDEVT